MAAWDYVIRRNNANTDQIPDSGSTLDLLWDTAVSSRGSTASYSSGAFTLAETGKYLIIYSDQHGSTSTNTTESLVPRCRLYLNGSPTTTGTCYGYIPKDNGAQEYILHCATVVDATADDVIKIVADRIDNTTTSSERPDRVADRSGIQIIKLDDTWTYALYAKASSQSVGTSNNSINSITWDAIVEEASPFSLVGGAGNSNIDVATTSEILCMFNLNMSGGSGDVGYQCRAHNVNSSNPGGFADDSFLNTNNGCDEWSLNAYGLWYPVVSGNDLAVQTICRGGASGTVNVDSGWLLLAELPVATDRMVIKDTTTANNINGSASEMTLTDASEVTMDTASFDHTGTVPEIVIQRSCDAIFFCNWRKGGGYGNGVGDDAVPANSYAINGTEIAYGGASTYNKGASNKDHASTNYMAFLPGLVDTDEVTSTANRIGTNTETMDVDTAVLSAFAIDPPAAPDAIVNGLTENTFEVNGLATGLINDLNFDSSGGGA